MDKIVPQYYKEYGMYVNFKKMFPDIRDGLLPVQRRTILAAYTIAQKSFTKTAKILGEIIGKWHPHAEQLGTVQWAVQNGFLDGDGWWGTKLGSEPSSCAAARYTNVKLSKFTYELALKYVKHVKWEPDELDPEPIAFPTMLPFCLICKYTQSFMGFGRKTTIPVYSKNDLINRLFDKSKVIKPKIIGATCISDAKTCRKLLESNKKVSIDFRIKAYKDLKSKSVYILSSPEFTFKNVIKKLGNLWTDQQVSFIELPVPKHVSRQLKCTKDETVCFHFTVNSKKNQDKIFQQLCNAVDNMVFSNQYEIVVSNIESEKTEQISVDEYLKYSYEFFSKTYIEYINYELKRIGDLKDELKIIKLLQQHLHLYKNTTKDLKTIIKELSNKIKYSEKVILDVITKYNIKTLLTINTDVSKYDEKIQELRKIKKNSKEYIDNMYKNLLEL